MHRLTRDRVRFLAAREENNCVSMYLPTHRAGPEVRQNPIAFRGLLSDARRALAAREVPQERAEATLRRAEELVDDREFWQNQGEGLAVFAGDDDTWIFRLPIPVDRLVIVGRRFHLKPVVPLLVHDGRYFVLALSLNRVRVFEATRFTMRELDLPGVPASLEDVVGADWEQRSLQLHMSTPAGDGSRTAEYHGHGVGHDDTDAEVEVFLRQVDGGLRSQLPDAVAPLVVASVTELYGEFRKITQHRNVVDGFIRGNPDVLDERDLIESGWRLVEPSFAARRAVAADRIRARLGTGRAIQQLQEVVVAAADGRVDELFVARGVERWGRFERGSRSVVLHGAPESQDEDLLNRATVEAITHDAEVFVVPPEDVPSDGSPVAAALRY